MGRRSAGPRDRTGFARLIIKALVAGAVALLLLWFAAKTAAVAELAKRQPMLAQQIAPDAPAVTLALASLEFRVRRGEMSEPTMRRILEVYRTTPLPEEPLLYAGISALVANDRPRAAKLFEEARRRAPRSRFARLFLLDYYLQTKQIGPATGEIGVLTRLMPQVNEVLIPELARFARNPQTSAALSAAVQRDPKLKQMLLSHLAATGASVDLLTSLSGSDFGSAANRNWQSKLIGSLAERGDISGARAIWRRMLGAKAGSELLYNGKFQSLPGPPPFNWTFISSDAGVAEPTSDGQLDVQFYGRKDAELAKQLLVLDPGRYRLAFQATGDAGGDGEGSMSWTVACAGSRSALANLNLREITYTARRMQLDFSVPSGCRGQWLTLRGVAQEFPVAEEVTIANVQLSRVAQ